MTDRRHQTRTGRQSMSVGIGADLGALALRLLFRRRRSCSGNRQTYRDNAGDRRGARAENRRCSKLEARRVATCARRACSGCQARRARRRRPIVEPSEDDSLTVMFIGSRPVEARPPHLHSSVHPHDHERIPVVAVSDSTRAKTDRRVLALQRCSPIRPMPEAPDPRYVGCRTGWRVDSPPVIQAGPCWTH